MRGLDEMNEYPEELMVALAEVRASNHCNMCSLSGVISELRDWGYGDIGEWLRQQSFDEWAAILMEFGRWLELHPPRREESLAQRVARETGLEVMME